MDKEILEKIANKIVKKIDEFEYNTEVSNSVLWKEEIAKNKIEFNDLFELDDKIIKKCENKNYNLNFGKYEGAYIGLPWDIPFIKEEKGIKKEIKGITISFGNYLNSEIFNIFDFDNNMKCGISNASLSFSKKKYVEILEEDRKNVRLICEKLMELEDKPFEFLDGGATYEFKFEFQNGTCLRRTYEELSNEQEKYYNSLKEIINRAEFFDMENIILKLAIYYKISTSELDDVYNLEDCFKILETELQMVKDEKETLFYFPQVENHIVNILYKNCIGLDSLFYLDLIETAMLKLNYYYSVCKDNSILYATSDEDIDTIILNIKYFNLGTETIKNKCVANVNKHEFYELAERYHSAKMFKNAFYFFSKAAEKGHTKARYNRILCLYKGTGVKQNYKEAFEELNYYFGDSINSRALSLLGEMYYLGKGTQKNYEQAFKLFIETEKFESMSKYYLFEMYQKGYGIEKNEQKAKEFLKQSASMKNKKAIEYIINNNIKFDDEFKFF